MEEKRLWLQNEVAGLNTKRYTPAILRKIGRVEAKEGPALWTDVKSVARCRKLSKETRALKDLKVSLEVNINCLNERKGKIRECVKPERARNPNRSGPDRT